MVHKIHIVIKYYINRSYNDYALKETENLQTSFIRLIRIIQIIIKLFVFRDGSHCTLEETGNKMIIK